MSQKDFIGPEFCAARNIRRTSRILTRYYDEILKSSGLKITQFSLLASLYGGGSMPITQLAEELVLERTTLTRNLKPLEKGGLVEIKAGEDRRIRQVALTDKGRETLFQTYPLWQKAQEQVLQVMGKTRYDRMLSDLTKLISIKE